MNCKDRLHRFNHEFNSSIHRPSTSSHCPEMTCKDRPSRFNHEFNSSIHRPSTSCNLLCRCCLTTCLRSFYQDCTYSIKLFFQQLICYSCSILQKPYFTMAKIRMINWLSKSFKIYLVIWRKSTWQFDGNPLGNLTVHTLMHTGYFLWQQKAPTGLAVTERKNPLAKQQRPQRTRQGT